MKRLISFSFIAILVLSTFIYAAGSSGSSSKTTKTEPAAAPAPPKQDCEDLTYLRERVRCRLAEEVKATVGARIHESCSAASDKAACQKLYDDSGPCYKITGTGKDQCFRNVAKESRRSYLILLLYDLEERVEERHANAELTDDEAADLVTKIVEVKQLILSGQPPGKVREGIQELKLQWSRNIK